MEEQENSNGGAGERAERDERREKTKLPSVTIDVNKYVLKFVLQLSVILFHIFKLPIDIHSDRRCTTHPFPPLLKKILEETLTCIVFYSGRSHHASQKDRNQSKLKVNELYHYVNSLFYIE